MPQSRFFFGLGVQKAGTTWLAKYLREHPQVYMPPIKELQIFSRLYRPDISLWMDEQYRQILNKHARSLLNGKLENPDLLTVMADMLAVPRYEKRADLLRAYRRIFRSRMVRQSVFGEMSATYCLLPEAGFAMMKASFPKPKFLLLLRDPVDRYWSHLRHRTRYSADFDIVSNFETCFDDPEIGQASDYKTVVANARRWVPAEDLHIAFYENMLIDNYGDSTLRAITDFLGIDFVEPDYNEIVYAGEPVEFPSELKIKAARRWSAIYEFVESDFGTLPTLWQINRALA